LALYGLIYLILSPVVTAADKPNPSEREREATAVRAEREELQKIRAESDDPVVQISKIAAWIEAHPRKASSPKPEVAPARPARNLTGKAALHEEIIRGLAAARAQSTDPKEQIRLVSEFLHRNRAKIEDAKPAMPNDSAAGKQAIEAHIKSRLAAQPNDVQAQMADALWDIRKEANPVRQVSLVAELLRLNKDLIKEALHPKKHATNPPPQ
jgi:hypothetical protein